MADPTSATVGDDHDLGASVDRGSVLPSKPRPSAFVVGGAILAVAFTIIASREVGFSLAGILEDLGRKNAPIEGLLSPDWGQITSDTTRELFVETFRMALLATAFGAVVSLPLALWSTTWGNPFTPLRVAVRVFAAVIRSIPDLLWALLFVFSVGIGVLSGLLGLCFFAVAVIVKLTSDVLDGIDHGPIEAARASGATTSQMLRTAVVPQVLPSYVSFVLYDLELNLRASAVLGLVGAGGIGRRIDLFKSQFLWSELWGVVFFFFIVVFFVERLSVALRRRLV